MYTLEIIGRTRSLLGEDILNNEKNITNEIQDSSFLVIGGAGSIGQAVVKELFSRSPRRLHVVDLSENNLVELVRDLRSSFGYIDGDFKTFAIDCGSIEFESYFTSQPTFDFVLNLSALKHVRSEKDPYTMMRMIDVNILNTIKTIELSIKKGVTKYFCVSTDKAANPVNMMGASKRIMEQFLFRYSDQIDISTARFANVAFSDGSLLHGFNKRLEKSQPISAPNDVRRYFVTFKEAGQLCMMSALFGKTREIFFPKLDEELNLITFSEIAERYLASRGIDVRKCSSEDEARKVASVRKEGEPWPCYFSSSDTTGEKDYEEFFMDNEDVDLKRYASLGIVSNSQTANHDSLDRFLQSICNMKKNASWKKEDIVKEFQKLLPEFHHLETGKYLDGKM